MAIKAYDESAAPEPDPPDERERLLASLREALGWRDDRHPSCDEADILAEIGRLRFKAGEAARSATANGWEMVDVALVQRFGYAGGPGKPGARVALVSLWTKAERQQRSEIHRGEPPETFYVDQPAKILSLKLDEAKARELRSALDEWIGRWDEADGRK